MKKNLALFLGTVLGVSCCFGCSKNEFEGENYLKVYVLSQGYGHAWAEDVIDSFKNEDWVKEKYPDINVKLDYNELDSSAITYLNSDKSNPYDVLISTNLSKYMDPKGGLADLTEIVFNAGVPGENIRFKDKVWSESFLDSIAYKGQMGDEEAKYYSVSYSAGFTGIAYNATKLEALGFKVPNTTDEWISIMQSVKDMNGTNANYGEKTSMITYGGSTYVEYLLNAFWAQYEGVEEYANFFKGYDTATESNSPNVLRQQGRLEALKVIENAMGKQTDYVMMEPTTGRAAYMNAQTKLLMGNALFMANGDWYDNEMKEIRNGLQKRYGSVDTVKFMLAPVISSIIDKTPSIHDDATLSKVVSAIDNGATSYEGVSEEDFAYIKNARKTIYSAGGPSSNAVIPASAKHIDIAADFLRYFATDKANAIYMRATDGCNMPFKYDVKEKNPELIDNFSEFQKGRIDYLLSGADYLPYAVSFPLVKDGSLKQFASANVVNVLITGSMDKGSYSSVAERLFEDDYSYWTRNGNSMWNLCLQQAGI